MPLPSEDSPRPGTMLAVCLVLLILIVLDPFIRFPSTDSNFDAQNEAGLQPQFQPGTVPSVPQESVSVRDPQFLPPPCTSLSSLPYFPSNPPFGLWEPYGTYGFLFASSHRISASSFAILGLSPESLYDNWGLYRESCLWVSFDGPVLIQGSLDFHFLARSQANASTGAHVYDVIVIHCALRRATPAHAGGALLLNIQGLDDVMVYRESPGPRDVNPPAPLPSTLTVCSTLLTAPQVGQSAGERIVEHMQFMSFVGADGFALYDGGGLDAEIAANLLPFVAKGLLEIVDFRALYKLRAEAATEDLAATDCAYRMRFRAAWAVVLAFDELPTLTPPSTRLSQLLRDNAGRPWLSLGVLTFDTEMCHSVHDPSMWLLEKMTWRHESPVCAATGGEADLCLGSRGMRRVVFDPRRVGLLTQHRVVFPALLQGLDLKTEEARVNKFVGLLQPGALICEYVVAEDHPTREWVKDTGVRELIQEGRSRREMTLHE